MSILERIRALVDPPAPRAPVRLPTAEALAGRMLAERPAVVEQALRAAQAGDPEWAEKRGEHWDRILNLGIRARVTEEDVEAFSYATADATAFDAGFRFRPAQVDCIRQFDARGGLLAQVRVGGGKTLVAVEIAARSVRTERARRVVIFCLASTYAQFMQMDLPRIRTWIPIPLPVHGLGGLSRAARARAAAQPSLRCFVVPYSLLSQPDAREVLERMAPDLVVADEAHYLKNRDSARTKRVLAYAEDHPGCRWAFMSGTLTNKQLLDYHHLAVLALGEHAPMPTSAMGGARWSAILSADSIIDVADAARELRPLHQWAVMQSREALPYTIDGYRAAYRHRLDTAPGVVLTKEGELGTSLLFQNLNVPTPGGELLRLMRQVTEAWLAPNGDEIAHAFHTYKWLHELTAGFYNDLVWPEPKNAAHAAAIERAKEHHAYKQLYERDLREFLRTTSIPHLDTPLLVGNAMARVNHPQRRHLPRELVLRWQAMKDREFDGMPTRQPRPVRVDDYKVRLAVEWAREAKGGILWVYHHELLDWCCEALEAAGVDHYPARAGDLAILDPANRDRIAVTSIAAHSEGKNLQYYYHRQLVLQWPRSAKGAEQMLGRTHREGQPEDELTVHLALGPDWDHQNYAATLCDALYMKLTTGQDQKVLYGAYAEPPRLYPPSFLEHAGFEGAGKVRERDLKVQFGG